MDINTNFANIQAYITAFEQQYHRKKGAVKLLAVSKGQPLEKLQTIYAEGQRAFGENHVQEALPKIAAMPNDCEWHFIGIIQTNKTRKIAEHFAWVHSVDSQKNAKRLNDQRPPHLPPLNICIEVNVSQDTNKAGVKKEDILTLAKYCQTLPRLALRGLMCIPAYQTVVAEHRHEFHELAMLFETLNQQGLNLDTLSMGMSADYEVAIAEGSTLLRLGTILFGQRE